MRGCGRVWKKDGWEEEPGLGGLGEKSWRVGAWVERLWVLGLLGEGK